MITANCSLCSIEFISKVSSYFSRFLSKSVNLAKQAALNVVSSVLEAGSSLCVRALLTGCVTYITVSLDSFSR